MVAGAMNALTGLKAEQPQIQSVGKETRQNDSSILSTLKICQRT